jgi:hypothetical protein
MASPAESTAAARRNESATEVWVHDEGVYRVDHFADHSRPVSFSATLGRVSFSDFLTADQADQLADALKAHAALVREREAQASLVNLTARDFALARLSAVNPQTARTREERLVDRMLTDAYLARTLGRLYRSRKAMDQ